MDWHRLTFNIVLLMLLLGVIRMFGGRPSLMLGVAVGWFIGTVITMVRHYRSRE